MRDLKKAGPQDWDDTISPPNLEYLDLKYSIPIGAVSINDQQNQSLNIQESNLISPGTGNGTCQT